MRRCPRRHSGYPHQSRWHDLRKILSVQLKLDHMNEQLRNAMATAVPNITCIFAYGMASFPAEGRTADEIMKLADQRMYEKKLAMR